MKSVFLNRDVHAAERNIISKLEIPSIILMENAGKNAAKIIKKSAEEIRGKTISILSGKGNNAGDGFVISRHLLNGGYNVNLLMLYTKESLQGDALTNFKILENSESGNLKIIKINTVEDVVSFFDFERLNSESCIVVDCVFGVGFTGKLENRVVKIFEFINSLKCRRIAIDTPSGINSDSENEIAFKADITISMAVKKFSSMFGEGKENSGNIETVDIGIENRHFDEFNLKGIYETSPEDVLKVFPSRKTVSNKYNNGKVFVIGGYPGYSGAAYLSSTAALKTGSGAVILGIPESMNSILETKTTEVITLPLPETETGGISLDAYDLIAEKIKWSDVTLIGPGLGRDDSTLELVRKILTENDNPYVIDADGLFALKSNLEILKKKRKNEIIITPHYGEFSNITGLSSDEVKKNFLETGIEFSSTYNTVLHLKNAPSITFGKDRVIINSTGRQNLATIGSGDVLSGIIASIFSINKTAIESTYTGAFLHGYCGDLLYTEFGNSSTGAGDLIEKIKYAKKELGLGTN